MQQSFHTAALRYNMAKIACFDTAVYCAGRLHCAVQFLLIVDSLQVLVTWLRLVLKARKMKKTGYLLKLLCTTQQLASTMLTTLMQKKAKSTLKFICFLIFTKCIFLLELIMPCHRIIDCCMEWIFMQYVVFFLLICSCVFFRYKCNALSVLLEFIHNFVIFASPVMA